MSITIFTFPAGPLFLAALLGTVLGRLLPKGRLLAYIGGAFWAAGTVAALVEGASLPEVLIAALFLLLCTWLGERRGGAP